MYLLHNMNVPISVSVYYWLSYGFAMAFLYSFAFALRIILSGFQISMAVKWDCVYSVLNILI